MMPAEQVCVRLCVRVCACVCMCPSSPKMSAEQVCVCVCVFLFICAGACVCMCVCVSDPVKKASGNGIFVNTLLYATGNQNKR